MKQGRLKFMYLFFSAKWHPFGRTLLVFGFFEKH
jgi:hypothetical protein